MLRIKLVKSAIANTPRNRATVAALGLHHIGHTLEKEDCPSIRGMVHHVKHLLHVTVVETGEVIADGLKVRKHATRKDKKPSETH
jgi:large subunit ribosomal protein L30